MLRPVSFLLFFVLPVAAQTPPPGPPFDASKHSNPIITFVEMKDFKPGSSAEIHKQAEIELLGISNDEGKLESIEIADGRFVKNMSIVGVRTDVNFYPVVRQRFALNDGAEFILHSFKFPRVQLPRDFTQIVLNEAAVERKKKPAEMRFGGEKPETLEIRGLPAVLFEHGGKTTVYWQENGAAHTATSTLPRRDLFEVIEGLL